MSWPPTLQVERVSIHLTTAAGAILRPFCLHVMLKNGADNPAGYPPRKRKFS
jgi:hypothetical protein